MEQNNHDDVRDLEFEESLLDGNVTPNQRYLQVSSDNHKEPLSEPILHKYMDMLEGLFTDARNRVNELNCMTVSSGFAERFEIMSFSSGRQAQFQNIKNLSLDCAQSMLRAEMLKVEHDSKVIKGLQQQILDLQRRLSVTETAEKYYSQLVNSMEKVLKQLLEDITDVEKQRVEKTAVLVERNEKLERTLAELKDENKKLTCRIEEQMDTMQKFEKELRSAELSCKAYRNQVDLSNSNMASLERENRDLSNKLSDNEHNLKLKMETESKLTDQVKTLEEKNHLLSERIASLQKEMDEGKVQAERAANEKDLEFRRKMDVELEKKRKEQEAALNKQKSAYETSIAKLCDETRRIKRDRDGLVAKVCEYENNIDTYKKQIYAEAQEKLTRGCQLAVTELAESASSTLPVSSIRSRSALGNSANPFSLSQQAQRLPTSSILPEKYRERTISELIRSLRPDSSANDYKDSRQSATSLSSRRVTARRA